MCAHICFMSLLVRLNHLLSLRRHKTYMVVACVSQLLLSFTFVCVKLSKKSFIRYKKSWRCTETWAIKLSSQDAKNINPANLYTTVLHSVKLGNITWHFRACPKASTKMYTILTYICTFIKMVENVILVSGSEINDFKLN